MMPFLGPYTIRSGIGDITDSFMSANDYLVDDDLITWGSRGWRALEYRADLLDAEDLIPGIATSSFAMHTCRTERLW